MANEKRLIDANALEEAITVDYYEHFTQYHDTDQIALIDMVREDIGNAPTVDAVEVVRCKDCKHYNGIMGTCMVDRKLGQTIPQIRVKHYDFCSYGERREGE